MPLEGGCSGSPIFDPVGRVIPIATASMEFQGGEHEGSIASRLTPIRHCLHLEFEQLSIPYSSWEFSQIPPENRGGKMSIKLAAKYGHVDFNPSIF
jgi:hypothetical protein